MHGSMNVKFKLCKVFSITYFRGYYESLGLKNESLPVCINTPSSQFAITISRQHDADSSC